MKLNSSARGNSKSSGYCRSNRNYELENHFPYFPFTHKSKLGLLKISGVQRPPEMLKLGTQCYSKPPPPVSEPPVSEPPVSEPPVSVEPEVEAVASARVLNDI